MSFCVTSKSFAVCRLICCMSRWPCWFLPIEVKCQGHCRHRTPLLGAIEEEGCCPQSSRRHRQLLGWKSLVCIYCVLGAASRTHLSNFSRSEWWDFAKRAHLLTGVKSLASSIVSQLSIPTLSLSGSDWSFPLGQKLAGVKIVSSLGSSESSGPIGREFKMNSIWQISVVNSSMESILLPITLRRCCFARLIADSTTDLQNEELL